MRLFGVLLAFLLVQNSCAVLRGLKEATPGKSSGPRKASKRFILTLRDEDSKGAIVSTTRLENVASKLISKWKVEDVGYFRFEGRVRGLAIQ